MRWFKLFPLLLVLCWCLCLQFVDCVPLPEDDDVCTICREPLNDFSTESIPQCGHSFHGSCIGEWKKLSSSCPICRADDGRHLTPVTNSLNIDLLAFVETLQSLLRPFIILKEQATSIKAQIYAFDQRAHSLLSEERIMVEHEKLIATQRQLCNADELLKAKNDILLLVQETFFQHRRLEPFFGDMLHKITSQRLKVEKAIDRRLRLLERTVPVHPLSRLWRKIQLVFSHVIMSSHYVNHMRLCRYLI